MAKYVDVIETGWQMRPQRIRDIDVFPIFNGQLRSVFFGRFLSQLLVSQMSEIVLSSDKVVSREYWMVSEKGRREGKMVEMRCPKGDRKRKRKRASQMEKARP